nr:hypothetical protein [Tanacetum cinerariifolium]
MVPSVKLPILKKGEYILWTMKMEHYLAYIDYALWEVILNGNSAVQMTKVKTGNEIKALLDHPQTLRMWLLSLLKSTSSTNELNATYSVSNATGHSSQAQGNRSRDARKAGYKGRDNGKRPAKEEDVKALVVQDGLGTYDWSYQVEEEATDFALMAFISNPSSFSSLYSEVQFCFKQCVQSYEQLKNLFDEQREKLRKANLEIVGYQYGLESIEGQLRVHQQNKVIYEKKIKVLEYDVKDKSNLLKYTQKQLDEALREKEELKVKLEKFETSLKNLTKLLDSQISAKVKTGLGYDSQFNEKEVLDVKEEEVTETMFDNRSSDEENSLANDRFKKGEGYHSVPPLLTGNYMPSKSDLSFARLDDFIYKFKKSETVTILNKNEKDAPETSNACVENPKEDSPSHPIKDCTFHKDRMAKKSVLPNNVGKGTGHKESRPVWNNVQRINHQNKFAPPIVFTRSGRIPVSAAKPTVAVSSSAAKPVDTAGPKQSVHFSKSRSHQQQALKNKGIIDSGCSRHMTGNKAYLANYKTLMMEVLLLLVQVEVNYWQRWLGHVNFKTMNKLVKGNLVRGLPSKIFENDNTYVACQKGKQHKATCKAKLDLDEFYEMKGIKKEYSNARTPHQNGVTERKNRTLIEVARTMLAYSLLPIIFWAKAVNAACYVLNRALVTKSHNKTLYELLNGRTPRLDFIRPFSCPVTILNTLDPLGKFKGKANEGFLVGYSVTSKAFRVFNTKTRKVKENLHVRFLENKPNVAGTGPNWIFDIDSLTNSTNDIPVFAGNTIDKHAGPQDTNGNAGAQDNVDARKEVSDQHYIMLPLWSSISSTFKNSDDKAADDKPEDDIGSKTVDEPVNKEDQAYIDELDRLMGQEKEASDAADALRKDFELGCMNQSRATKAGSTNSFNTVSNPVNVASTSETFSAGGPSLILIPFPPF